MPSAPGRAARCACDVGAMLHTPLRTRHVVAYSHETACWARVAASRPCTRVRMMRRKHRMLMMQILSNLPSHRIRNFSQKRNVSTFDRLSPVSALRAPFVPSSIWPEPPRVGVRVVSGAGAGNRASHSAARQPAAPHLQGVGRRIHHLMRVTTQTEALSQPHREWQRHWLLHPS